MKKFNARKSPYKQILAHNGPCILTVVDKNDNSSVDRIRAISPEVFKVFKSRVVYSAAENMDYFCPSCYVRGEYYTLEECVMRMKVYDKKCKLKIIHIDFY